MEHDYPYRGHTSQPSMTGHVYQYSCLRSGGCSSGTSRLVCGDISWGFVSLFGDYGVSLHVLSWQVGDRVGVVVLELMMGWLLMQKLDGDQACLWRRQM